MDAAKLRLERNNFRQISFGKYKEEEEEEEEEEEKEIERGGRNRRKLQPTTKSLGKCCCYKMKSMTMVP